MPSPLRVSPADRQANPAEGLRGIHDALPASTGSPAAPLLVEPREAARLLAISERTLWARTESNEVPCVRIGRAKRYALADLAAYVERLRAGE